MTAILAATLKSAVPLMLALGVMPMLRRQAAGLRHLVLTTAIAAAVLTPLAGLALPSWSLPPQLTAPLFAGDRTTAAERERGGSSRVRRCTGGLRRARDPVGRFAVAAGRSGVGRGRCRSACSF